MATYPTLRRIDAAVELVQRESVPLDTTDVIVSDLVMRGYHHWAALKGDRAFPLRKDLDPAAIPSLLPYLYMVDVIGNGADFRYRLLGTDIVKNTIRDNTGKLLSELRDQGSQPVLERFFRDALTTAAPRLQRIAFTTRAGLRSWYEAVAMPMGNDPANPPDILIGFAEHFTQPVS